MPGDGAKAPPRSEIAGYQALFTGLDSGPHFGDGVINDRDGLDSVTALVMQGNLEFVAGGPKVTQGGIHVGLVGPHVFDENAASGHESEGEGEE